MGETKMSNYEVHKNVMNDYKYILFTAPWSGRYKYAPRTHKGVALYKAMVMSSGKVHLWVARVLKSLRDVPVDTMQVTLNVLGANKTLREWCPNIKEIVFGEE